MQRLITACIVAAGMLAGAPVNSPAAPTDAEMQSAWETQLDSWELRYREGSLEAFGRTRQVLWFSFDGDNGSWTTYAGYIQEHGVVFANSILEKNIVAKDRRLAVCEYLSRVNDRIAMGFFHLDFDTGVAGFMVSSLAESSGASQETLENVLAWNLVTVDKYLPGMLEVLYGSASPTDALARVLGE